MSKVSMPRPRYVAFELAAAKPLSRRAVANAVQDAAKAAGWTGPTAPALTRYGWPHGIVRVEHTDAARARKLLSSLATATEGKEAVAVKATTLSTSGTLSALTQRLGVLATRDAPTSSGSSRTSGRS